MENDDKGFLFDERYAEAFFHVRDHRVLGITLRPFSAWHRTVLEYLNSPVMTGEAMTGPDLRMAATVCSLAFPDLPPPPPKGVWARLKAEHQAIKDQKAYAREVEAFWRYVGDYVSLPFLMVNNRKGDSKEIPDIDQTLMDVALYRYYTACPREEPWNLPLGELIWMNSAMAKTQGADIHVVSTHEEAKLKEKKPHV